MRFVDLTGKRFGRLIAQWPAGRGSKNGKFPTIFWLCLCDCGGLVTVQGLNLVHGNTTSCGCYQQEMRKSCHLKHGYIVGKIRRPEYTIFLMAKHRARRDGLPFNIELSDVKIPERCPLLGIVLVQGKKKLHDASPTLDRIRCEEGYVKGNVRVISYKANRAKGNLTLDEMKLMVANWST